ncbi:MAG TPA: hypothetical protein VFP34_15235 [Microlunatus sp.]|nr:hypothetical protein [Microlunatus sp.]
MPADPCQLGLGERGLGERGLGELGLGERGLGELDLGELGLGEPAASILHIMRARELTRCSIRRRLRLL